MENYDIGYRPNPTQNLRDLTFRFVRTLDDFLEMKRWMGNRRRILGVDLETSGLDWTRERSRLFQVGDGTGGWAVPSEGWEKPIAEVMHAYDGDIVFHNGDFDLHYMDRYFGYVPKSWHKIHDTLTQIALLDPPGSHKLKIVSARHVNPQALIGKNALEDLFAENDWWWDTVPVDHPTYWGYGILDTCLTAMLFETLEPVIKIAGLTEAYELERRVAEAIFYMERVGMAIDKPFIEEQRERLMDQAEEVRERAFQTYGVRELGSMKPCVEAFLNDGVPEEALMKIEVKNGKEVGRKLSLDRTVLGSLVHPLADLIRQYRKLRGLAGNFLKNTYDAGTLSHDGFVHPGINQHEARTHRMSITRPALQQQPRINPNDPTSRICRDAFVARPGHLLVGADFSNVEARLFANYAQEPGMLAAIREGIDLHCYTAMQAYRLDGLPSKSDPRRATAKNTLFCLLYGGGPGKIAVTAGISLTEAEDFVGKLYTAFPGIQKWQKDTIRDGRWRRSLEGVAYVELSDHRRLTLPPGDDKDYVLTNYAIQGEAGVLFKRKIVACLNAGLRDYLRLPIHDELLCEAPEADAYDIGRLLVECMADDVRYSVPIAAEMSPLGTKWGDCK